MQAYLLPWEPTFAEVVDGVTIPATFNGYPNQHFGRLVTIHRNTSIVTSVIDGMSKYTADYSKAAGGSAYVFKNIAGLWTQQQKLVADDLAYNQPGRGLASDLYKRDLPSMVSVYMC